MTLPPKPWYTIAVYDTYTGSQDPWWKAVVDHDQIEGRPFHKYRVHRCYNNTIYKVKIQFRDTRNALS